MSKLVCKKKSRGRKYQPEGKVILPVIKRDVHNWGWEKGGKGEGTKERTLYPWYFQSYENFSINLKTREMKFPYATPRYPVVQFSLFTYIVNSF